MRIRLALIAVVALLVVPVPAQAKDPGRWVLTGVSSLPITYFQGLTSDPSGRNVYFDGPFQGLWRTTPLLHQLAGNPSEIPAGVTATEQYNHVGDPTYDRAEGGRLLLPMESFNPAAADTNPSKTGSLGVADPGTLAWRYYVKLSPAEIPKAMWAEVSPDGSRVWTSAGNDLLAYSAADVNPANAGPGAAPIHSVARLAGAVPPSGVTGAVFRKGKLLIPGGDGKTLQTWSVDPVTGKRRLEIEAHLCGESEGVDTVHTLGGSLQWLVSPVVSGCKATYGPSTALLHFVPRPGPSGLKVAAKRLRDGARRVRVRVRVTRHGKPLEGARVTFAGSRTQHTNRHGYAVCAAPLVRPGRFKVLARAGKRFGLSRFVVVKTASAASIAGGGPDAALALRYGGG
ncbi:MAG TPA: hypothetical protein VH256_03835 [Thermoleophilaceae bacterium]|nr:hypothetical protein [Thermoleophilaceae bacterium]